MRGVVEPTSGTPCVWRLSCCSYYKAETWQTSSRSRCSSPDNPTNHNQPRYPRDQGQCSVQFPRFRPSLMARRGWAALFGLTADRKTTICAFLSLLHHAESIVPNRNDSPRSFARSVALFRWDVTEETGGFAHLGFERPK